MEVSQVVKAGIKGSIAHPESADLVINLLEADLVTESDLTEYVKKDGSESVEKINLDINPTLGTLVDGDLYYDQDSRTVAIDLPNDLTLHVSQEDTFIGQNMSGATIPKGKIVYITGTLSTQPRIALARADLIAPTSILGMVAEDIPNLSKGLVITRGPISGIDTDAFFTDSTTYLSESLSGEMVSTPPTSISSLTITIGRVLVSNNSTGKMFITFDKNNNLTDLADVDISSPLLDQVLRYNGAYWINGAETSTSPAVGANFFLDNTVVIPQGSGPQSVETFSLLKNPTTATQNILTATVNNSTSLIKYFIYNKALGGSFIDAGNWNFKTYASVSQSTGNTTLPIVVRKIVTQVALLDIMGIGTTRTAFATGMFSPSDFNLDLTLATYIQTPNALLRIIGYTDANSVSVETLSTYTNETDVVFSKHINLFEDTPSEINSSLPILINSETTRSAISITSTDKLSIAYYARTDAVVNTDVSLYINGTNNASYLITPIATRHNDLIGLQGGSASEQFHMTLAEYNTLLNTSGINTGDQDLSDYELNTNKSTSIIIDQASNIKYPSVKSVYDWATSTFESGIGYTAENIANKATNLLSPDNTKYPTTLAVQNAIDLLPTDHSELTGLSNDDHTQYTKADGTRAFSGDQSLGNNALTNVSTINGIVPQTHASRHLPNGADALTTGTPSAIGTANSTGTANAFARQDHIHSHGDQTSPTHHAIATTIANGFMSSTDKTKLDGIQSGATANSTDAQLRDRATHTGTQSVATITGLGALATKNTIETTDIVDDNVTNDKLANMSAFTLKGNSTASPANPQDLSVSSVKTLLSIDNVDNTSDINKPISTATQTALNAKENTIVETTSADYYRGDKTFQPLNKSAVGLSNVDNTSDLNKPISTATQTALNGKESNITATTSADYYRGDKTFQPLNKAAVGLGNVDNTTDANKPVSIATQNALDLKEDSITSGTVSQYWRGDKTFQTLDKASVGLGNVDNTADGNKPVSGPQATALAAKENTANKGVANGYASLDSGGKVPSSQLPSYVDDILEFADFASFPVTGETGKIYVAIDTDKTYRWSGSVYVEISSSPVTSVNGYTGIVTLSKTDISLGNVVNLDTSTTANITDSVNKRFVSDAEKTVLANTSGTNTGDQDLSGLALKTTTVNGYALSSNVTLTKSDIGLSNVDNTSDLSKPISTDTQDALDLKYDASNPDGFETPTQLNTRDTNNRDRANHTGMQVATTITEDSTHRFATDAEKSTWNTKEPAITSGTTSEYYRGDKTFQTLDKTAVGLSNVDNTSDLNKPISTAVQLALDLKADLPVFYSGEVELDFGSNNDYVSTIYNAAWIDSSKSVILQIVPNIIDHDPEDVILEQLNVTYGNVINGTSLEIHLHAPETTWGRYKVKLIGV